MKDLLFEALKWIFNTAKPYLTIALGYSFLQVLLWLIENLPGILP